MEEKATKVQEPAASQKPAETKPKAKTKKPASNGTSDLETAGLKILDRHPEKDVVYMTSDGFGYWREHDASNHARDLKDNIVVTVKK